MKRIIVAVAGVVLVSIAGVIVKGMLKSNSDESTDVETTSEPTSED